MRPARASVRPSLIILRSNSSHVAGAGGEEYLNVADMEVQMDMRSYSAKNYLKLDDLADGPLIKTIVAIAEGSFEKPEAEFDDGSKLSLNRTSVLALSKAYGWNSDDWVGQSAEIYAGEVTFKGTTTRSVLVTPIDAPAKKPIADDLNDSINF
jgi:hypothetical protein